MKKEDLRIGNMVRYMGIYYIVEELQPEKAILGCPLEHSLADAHTRRIKILESKGADATPEDLNSIAYYYKLKAENGDEYHHFEFNYDVLEGLILGHNILVDWFGFIKISNNYFYNNCMLKIEYNSARLEHDYKAYFHNTTPQFIEYVHELQNLYFLSTGKEHPFNYYKDILSNVSITDEKELPPLINRNFYDFI